MPAISKFRGIIFRLMKLPYRGLAVYANQGERELMLDAVTLEVIAGSAPSRLLETVIEWSQLHEAELKQILDAMQDGRTPRRVAHWL